MSVVAALGGAYLLAAGAALIAVFRMRPRASRSPGALAMTVWWAAATGICLLQAVEAIALSASLLSPSFAAVLGILRAAAVAIGLGFLAYASRYLAIGRAPHPALFVAGGSTLFVLMTWAIASVSPATLARERLIEALVRGAPEGMLAWGAMLLVPAFAIVPLALSTMRAPPTPARRRATIVSLGILAGIAGFLAGGWGSAWLEPFTETAGVLATGAAVLAAYVPASEPSTASAAAS